MPYRRLGETLAVILLLAVALRLERVPPFAFALVLIGAVAVGHGTVLSGRDAPARRPVVVLARVATWWSVVSGLPLTWFAGQALGVGAVLWLPIALLLGPVGTYLLRDRHDVAGAVVKAVVLVPPAAAVFATGVGVGGCFSVGMVVFGAATLGLALAIAVAAGHAYHYDPAATP